MPESLSAERFVERLEAHRSEAEAKKYRRIFRTGEGEVGQGDEFIGVRMGQVFALAKEFIDMPLHEIEKLLESPVHEVRVGGVSIMDYQARSKRSSEQRKQQLYNLYLERHDRINNWDLVDRAAPYVVGGYLYDKPRDVLYELARSRNPWERRTAIVSTGYFIRQSDVVDTFQIAESLLHDEHALVQKATGWMLREAGKKDPQELLSFLDRHALEMPRTLLRYAVENLDPDQRARYLGPKKLG